MKIGIDATPLPNEPVGAGRYTIQLIRALIDLIEMKSGSDEDIELYIFVQKNGRRQINAPNSPRIHWRVFPEKHPLARLVWEQVRLPFLIRRSKIDILHSLHYTRPVILPCASVVTFHDMTFFLYPDLHTRIKRKFFPAAIRYSARHSQAIITTSECTKQDTIRLLNVPAEKMFSIPNGVGEEFRPISEKAILEECRRKYRLPEEFILNVGLIEPRKNLSLLLRAYAKLCQRRECPPIVITGGFGWMYDEAIQQIDMLDLKDKVQFTGYIPAQDLPMVYNLARIFVYPSLYEGFGFPPLEAMACGIPVITTSISAMLDQVGDAGILVPPNDECALLEAMDDLLGDRRMQEFLSKSGRTRSAYFTWKRTAQETLRVYQCLGKTAIKNSIL